MHADRTHTHTHAHPYTVKSLILVDNSAVFWCAMQRTMQTDEMHVQQLNGVASHHLCTKLLQMTAFLEQIFIHSFTKLVHILLASHSRFQTQ